MWRFVTGAKAPKEKEKQSENERNDYQASYESQKRKHSVLPHWTKNRPWLRVTSTTDHDIMFCDYCIKAGVSADKSVFVKGCTSIRVESTKYHQDSSQHTLAVNRHMSEMKPSEAPAAKAHESLNKAFFPKLELLCRNVHALNVKARLHVDYIWMYELDEKKGMEIGERLQISLCMQILPVLLPVFLVWPYYNI